jgi:hypothetical protein
MRDPEDVIRHLARGVRHWKGGYSAHSLATLWFSANDFPAKARELLDSSAIFRGAKLVDGFFERQTELGDGERPSQTDLLAVARIGAELTVIGVEGKAEEPFGETVGEWLEKNTNRSARETRLKLLCEILGISQADRTLRYQLFHRSAACVIEAERYGANSALLLVHSFSEKQSSLRDYKLFVGAVGPDADLLPSAIAGPIKCNVSGRDIALYFGWITDRAEYVDFWPNLQKYADDTAGHARTVSEWITKRS